MVATPPPDRRPIGVVVNPTAGGGRAGRRLPMIVAALGREHRPYHLHVTTAPRDAIAVARRFAVDGVPLVLAVGGDGTVNEIANGLLDAGTETALGVVPAGRGADFARTLGIPSGIAAAIRCALTATPQPVDIGRATFGDGSTRAFVNVAGLGFDAAVGERAATSPLPGSTVPYLHGLLAALLRYRNLSVEVAADGDLFFLRALSVVVANGRFFGGGMQIVPPARLDDGRLDLAILGDVSKLDLLRNVPRVYRGTHTSHPKFFHRPVRSVDVASSTPIRVQLDGEVVGATPVRFTVEPNALLIAR